ncbi:ABC transporter permease [Pseudonocardia sp. HH130630-07]|uniref:ABC transporter permease n=1 Tax=Pseudonocardia sp. HH130630-07 TaxID=1690815 RepID=UPI00081512E5|nr:ABC transporter permease [Pseudonocardia sp. HH130630-07]ANY07183.1 hypothetical protein AFB00_13830 [Pseudonocardia sp. HH130630-07]
MAAPADPAARVRRTRGTVQIAVPAALIALIVLVAVFPAPFAGLFGAGDVTDCDLALSRQGPSPGHPFGLDVQGCDLWAQVVHGTRASVSVGVLVTLGCLLVAAVLGTLAAWYGGWVDSAIGRLIDVFLGFPQLVGLIVVLTVVPVRTVPVLAAVLVLFTWPHLTRVMRASALGVVGSGYVRAAEGIGAAGPRVLLRHVLPNAAGPVLAVAGLTMAAVITSESALTFLGVGLQAPSISWGVQLATAQTAFRSHPHLLVFPAAALTVTVLAFVLLGDALRTRLDPRSRS